VKARTDHRRLILVKHAEPVVDPDVPPNHWELSEGGKVQSEVLAERLRRYRPAAVVTSEEPKAAQTARVVAERLSVAAAAFPGLHEHDRTGAPFGTQAEFELAARGFFENPSEVVWGRESAEEARERFTGAVGAVLARHPTGDVVVVAHGTVITLFVSRFADLDAFRFWRRLGMPSLCVLQLPGYELNEVVADLAS
jgi:broad specificity phosphatase PhoE